jgi:thiol-disulfide isomerase/thioredoxin
MKNFQQNLPILVLLVSLAVCCQQNRNNQGNSIEKKVDISSLKADSNQMENLYYAMLEKQNQISVIEYNVRRIDTFNIKTVWDHKGIATLQRNSHDSIFGFSYYGKREDLARESFYIENRLFQVFEENRTYKIETNYGHHTLGSPGGQMVVVDLLRLDYYEGDISIKICDPDNFIVTKTRTTSDSTVIVRQIFVDRKTLMPYKIYHCTINKLLELKQTTTYYITEMKTNEQVATNRLSEMGFLSEYTQNQIIDRSADKLLHKKAPDILLVTFNGDSLLLQNLKSKVTLLDFWELWCGPCRQALPKVNEISTNYNSKDLIIIGIVSEGIEGAKKLILQEKISFLNVIGNQELKTKFMVNSFPRYILIDQNHVIRNIYYGFSTNIEADIKNLL